jgi:perosamine synthetase
MLRFVPPAGSPVAVEDVFGAARLASGDDTAVVKDCLAEIASNLGVKHIEAVCSGRAGLVLIVRALQRLRPGRDVVAVPAYTCFSVVASLVRAGVKVLPVEVNPTTLDFDLSDLSALPQERLLAIITSNLFGLVNDVPQARRVAREKGAFLIDDAAQAFGATSNGSHAGTLGDVGFYSLGRGKALTTGEGGLVVTDCDDIAAALQEEASGLRKASLAESASVFAKMLATSVLMAPRLFWIPNSLSFLKLGVTEFDPNFEIRRVSGLSLALLSKLSRGLPELNRRRALNAQAIARLFEETRRFSIPTALPGTQPLYTRFPVLADDQVTRDRALRALRQVGIGATAFYPSAICDIPEMAPHMAAQSFHKAGAEQIAQRMLTLPTHAYLKESDLQRIGSVLRAYE